MKTVVTEVIAGATPTALFEHLGSLERYPAWMRLVHRATPLDPDEGRPAWWVELRARVGPFTRSKQLRMVRTEFEPGRLARFERIQADDRDHAEWILTARVDPSSPDGELGAQMTMYLEYTGQLWSRAVLGKILDDEIRRSTKALSALLIDGDVGPASDVSPATVQDGSSTH